MNRHKSQQSASSASARNTRKRSEAEKAVIETAARKEESIVAMDGKKRDRRTIEQIQKEMLGEQIEGGNAFAEKKRVKREE